MNNELTTKLRALRRNLDDRLTEDEAPFDMDLDALDECIALASRIEAGSPEPKARTTSAEPDGAALSAGTPQPPASLAEGGAEPYTMTENEQGYWRINGPTRVEGEWFRRADAESNLRIVNAAFAAGQASQPTKGAEGKVLTDSEGHLPAGVTPIESIAHYIAQGVDHLKPLKEDEEGDMAEDPSYQDRVDDLIAILPYAFDYALSSGYLASQPLGEPQQD